MKYTERYEKAKKSGKAQEITSTIWKAVEIGDRLVGKIIEIKDITFEDTKTTCKEYILDTDDGVQSIVLGTSYDRNLEHKMKIGAEVAITWGGKRDLDGGRTFNIWKVELFEGVVKDE